MNSVSFGPRFSSIAPMSGAAGKKKTMLCSGGVPDMGMPAVRMLGDGDC